jgi:hypothetical protein
MDFQFYPTPLVLGTKAWAKFKNKNFVRVMEPSAGKGDLIEAAPFKRSQHHRNCIVDCCEIDVSLHPALREKDVKIVGHDFLQFGNGVIYSHVIMNPPFSTGAAHVLKAWDMLWDGEIVAILNAETVRNPFSAERQLLARILANHGSVEFIDGAFATSDAERKTNVDIALIYLRKEADIQADIIGTILDDMRKDRTSVAGLAGDFREEQMLALPNSTVENMVLSFDAAVRAMRESVFGQAKERYYTALLGMTMAERNGEMAPDRSASASWVQQSIGEQYKDLKDRAWACILHSTKVTSRLSSAAQRRIESEFDQIKMLEFTAYNIYGFLSGLMEKQGEIQIGMACDVFDLVTRYHSDNTVFYKGWKSNDGHRRAGMRIRMTRFILPNHGCYSSGLRYESTQLLRDFDKVFAMLDGKLEPEIGLVDAFKHQWGALRTGSRISTSYFDVRYYPGAGTIHFFANSKTLVDRLNRLVGKHRRWLPPDTEKSSDIFWSQYNLAEKLDKEMRAAVSKRTPRCTYGYGGPLQSLVSGRNDESLETATNLLMEAATEVLRRHGIDPDLQIEVAPTIEALLLAA